MRTVHPAVKIFTATVFITLMSGFVAFKSGAFDGTRSAQIKLHVSKTGLSHHRKSNDPNKKTLHKKRQPLTPEQERTMIHSSKTIITSPVDWSLYGRTLASNAMMSSSKSSIVTGEAELYSVYQGIFGVPYAEQARDKNAQLKQGKKYDGTAK